MPDYHLAYAFCGGTVLLYTLVDIVWTTMHRGGGPITQLILLPIWGLMVHGERGTAPNRRLTTPIGLGFVLCTIAVWGVLIWTGWTLIFLGGESSVVHTSSGLAAGLSDRIYFVGYTIFTLGNGDFKPSGFAWQLCTVVASFSGFTMVTLSLAYLIPLVLSVVSKRALANRIHAACATPNDLIASISNDSSEPALERLIASVLPEMAEMRHRHELYPVLHFFHGDRVEDSLVVALARLDEALRFARLCVAKPFLSDSLERQWRILIEQFVTTLGGIHDADVAVPPIPRLADLAGDKLPRPALVSAAQCAASYEDEGGMRRRLHAMVLRHGWTWLDVEPPLFESPGPD